jgi:hypothetical protein
VASAIVWVGGGIMLPVVGIRARRSSDAALLAEFGRFLHSPSCGSSLQR